MKEECKLCNVSEWCGSQGTTDFSISTLMRPAVHRPSGPQATPPARDALLLSAYLLKLGYYQPAGPLIKETGVDAERALARYHPHYHAPHPPVLQQYGAPYYPAELCYRTYYRPPGSYHLTPPPPDAPMGVGGEPYPPPQYYGGPPCYQHSPQRIPYMEYRGCPCPLNACPKNVHIGPATGKAPASGGPDVQLALAPPGGAFRPKVRAGALDSAGDIHGSGKDPPLESVLPMTADTPHPCPVPAIGGASPKRELYDVRENLHLKAIASVPTEAIGPPSPARGACASQPTPSVPRRARLGKAMARRSLAGDDTSLLITVPVPPSSNNSDGDDDVLAISPPVCAPIDLSSSDERSTPLVDIKKENEGPTNATSRKTDTQALKEHNSTTISDTNIGIESTKPVKRRHSRTKLEIDMKDVHLEEACKTNGIGEHVKLQKRRKVSSDQTEPRVEISLKDQKKKTSQNTKKTQRISSTEKKGQKRKSDSNINEPKTKKTTSDDANKSLNPNNKFKSAVLLDNLIKKNSLDRVEQKGPVADSSINPAKLFLSPNENVSENQIKSNLINSEEKHFNVIKPPTPTVTPLRKKLTCKNTCKIDSKNLHNLSVLLPPPPNAPKENINHIILPDASKIETKRLSVDKNISDSCKISNKTDDVLMLTNQIKVGKQKQMKKTDSEQKNTISKKKEKCQILNDILLDESQSVNIIDKPISKNKFTAEKSSGELKGKNLEKIVKLLPSRKKSKDDSVPTKDSEIVDITSINKDPELEKVTKRNKINVLKKTAIKSDEASLVIKEACSVPVRAPRRGRNGIRRRRRQIIAALPAPQARLTPKWSNGWTWAGENYLSKVYLNNDSRLDRTALCYTRMTHASGDGVSRGDCVLLRASQARAQPFVARIASLWENPDDGEMMMSLVWYYRPEHTERGRQPTDAPDEVFASRHRDANSVACIEDKCYVLTFNEYCRYKKRLKAVEEGINSVPSIVPALPTSEVTPAVMPNDTKLPPSISPELVLFCRRIYDFRSKKIHVPNK